MENIQKLIESARKGWVDYNLTPMASDYIHIDEGKVFCCAVTAAYINDHKGSNNLDPSSTEGADRKYNCGTVIEDYIKKEYNLNDKQISNFINGFDENVNMVRDDVIKSEEYQAGLKLAQEIFPKNLDYQSCLNVKDA